MVFMIILQIFIIFGMFLDCIWMNSIHRHAKSYIIFYSIKYNQSTEIDSTGLHNLSQHAKVETAGSPDLNV